MTADRKSLKIFGLRLRLRSEPRMDAEECERLGLLKVLAAEAVEVCAQVRKVEKNLKRTDYETRCLSVPLVRSGVAIEQYIEYLEVPLPKGAFDHWNLWELWIYGIPPATKNGLGGEVIESYQFPEAMLR